MLKSGPRPTIVVKRAPSTTWVWAAPQRGLAFAAATVPRGLELSRAQWLCKAASRFSLSTRVLRGASLSAADVASRLTLFLDSVCAALAVTGFGSALVLCACVFSSLAAAFLSGAAQAKAFGKRFLVRTPPGPRPQSPSEAPPWGSEAAIHWQRFLCFPF